MYLAKLQKGSKINYQLRKSYQKQDGSFGHKIVYDLGDDPSRVIIPFEDHIVLFEDELQRAVSANFKGDEESLLEQLLWDFLPQPIKRRLETFQHRNLHSGSQRFGRLTSCEQKEIDLQVHLFDRRRLYYLRYGAIDQSRLSRLHEKCCRPLLGQSRDEREYYFTAEEMVLDPGKYLQYVYAIFNLQRYFSQSFAPWLPESLALDEMAEHLEKEICRLNSDRHFWQQDETPESLHHHLRRYLIMFFDYSPRPRSYLEDFAKAFMAGHRTFRWPDRKQTSTPEKISKIFQTPYEELKTMNKSQLSRLYRQKAMQLHPDLGGDHELFIELTEVYNQLLSGK